MEINGHPGTRTRWHEKIFLHRFPSFVYYPSLLLTFDTIPPESNRIPVYRAGYPQPPFAPQFIHLRETPVPIISSPSDILNLDL